MDEAEPAHPASDPGFVNAWSRAALVPGWLSESQAWLLWREAGRLDPHPMVVEIGSHRGRSTTVLGTAMAEREGTVVAIDPFVEGRLFGGKSTRDEFEENIKAAGLDERVRLIPEYSTRLRASWVEPIHLLYVDGKHDYWTCSDDLRWCRHLPEGGPVLVHDAFSSIGVTLAILLRVLPGRDLTYVERAGSLALFRRTSPRMSDRGRILLEVPWWLRNVAVKVLLRLRLRRLVRLLGHSGDFDPY